MKAPLPLSRWMVLAHTALLLGSLSIANLQAEDTKPASAGQSAASPADQEAKLIAAFTNATLNGRWAPLKDGKLGPEKEDTYQIVGVKKLDGDKWELTARFQYQGQSMDLPIPMLVKWSGDTTVLIFDNISLGTPRSYSARLMIHENTYAGTWSGGDHGGMLYGVIVH